ncbi:hypothetical protein BJX76DRAFT_326643 [Aspergillus varians]
MEPEETSKRTGPSKARPPRSITFIHQTQAAATSSILPFFLFFIFIFFSFSFLRPWAFLLS